MHYSVVKFFTNRVKLEQIRNKKVLEVGSLYINGSIRNLIVPIMYPGEYIGIDMQEGYYVDSVMSASELVTHFGINRFDAVVCTEMLEHAKDWKSSIFNMKSVLQEEGLLVLTTRSEGFPLHSYPDDYWRFSIDDMSVIFQDFNIVSLESDPQDPGVFLTAIKPVGWENQDLTNIEVYSMEREKQ